MQEQQPPSKTGLLEFFKKSAGSQFVIPVYQRNYTWTAGKEVKQYLEDLENVLNGKYDKHFLGILIYLDTPITFATREFSVIDGQQRITTTFLILYAIKHLMIKNDKNEDANILDSQFLTNQFVEDKLKLKLKPLVADDEVYQQVINNNIDEITNKNSNIYKNYEFIKNKMMELLKEYTFNDILMALNKLYIVSIPVVNSDSPQKIFESINSTGAKLLSADLIRNYILMDIDSDTQEKYYADYWKKIEEYITGDSKKLELFFRVFLACKMKNLSNIVAIYNDFKIWYSNEQKQKSIKEILIEITRYSKYYYTIYSKPLSEIANNKIREALSEFRNNLSEMPAPFLMEIYALYDTRDEEGNGLILDEDFSKIVNIVNTYLIRRSICALDTSDITRLFPTLLKDVLDDCNGNYANIVEYVKKNLINKNRGKAAYMPNDEAIRNYLEYANVYNNRLTLRIIFDKMETYNNSAPVDLKKLSVEHLMPQTPTKEWLETLKIDETVYEKNLNRIGNLTLATKVDNSKMKNNPWDYKKSILKETAHLIMNQKILEIEKWDINQIDRRNKELIEEIIKLYPFSSASDSVINKHEIAIDWDSIYALAYLFEEDGSVEVQAGSEIVKYNSDKIPDEWQYELYNELLAEGVIKETEEGAVFVKPYLFTTQKKNQTALSTVAGLLLCGNRNGWEYWKDEKGNSLNSDTELKKRLTQN